MLEYTEAQYQAALGDLDAFARMQPAELPAHDIAGGYESAIRNVAAIYGKAVDTVVCDLQTWRAGRRSQEVAA